VEVGVVEPQDQQLHRPDGHGVSFPVMLGWPGRYRPWRHHGAILTAGQANRHPPKRMRSEPSPRAGTDRSPRSAEDPDRRPPDLERFGGADLLGDVRSGGSVETDPGPVGQVGDPLGPPSTAGRARSRLGQDPGRQHPAHPSTTTLPQGTWAPWTATIGTASDHEPGSDVQR
jgi:hypothetical protein